MSIYDDSINSVSEAASDKIEEAGTGAENVVETAAEFLKTNVKLMGSIAKGIAGLVGGVSAESIVESNVEIAVGKIETVRSASEKVIESSSEKMQEMEFLAEKIAGFVAGSAGEKAVESASDSLVGKIEVVESIAQEKIK